jgi:polar amino acid transport system substrate-binding protein
MRPAAAMCALAIVLTACGGNAGAGANAEIRSFLPSEIRKSGVVRVGSDIEYPPLEFYAEGSSTPQGFDVDLGAALAKLLDVRFDFVNFTDLEGLLPALNAGRFDVVMSGMVDTAERREQGVAFVDYLMAGTSILVAKNNPRAVKSLDDLCGQEVVVQKDTEQDIHAIPLQSGACRAAGRPEVNVIAFESEARVLEQLRRGRAIAALVDAVVAGYSAKTVGFGIEFDVAGGPVGAGMYGIGVATENVELRDALVRALAALIADGTYRALLEKWGLTQAAIAAPTVNGG